jgi:hypothetical protein
MPSEQLENLVVTGQLKREAPDRQEIEGLLRSGSERLGDADLASLSANSRFDLAYNAAHALSLTALRWHGYRPANRYIVFLTLAHTVDLPAEQWRVLDAVHKRRNRLEYEGFADVDEDFVASVLRVTREVAKRVKALVR